IKMIIWDWNGTLLNDVGVSIDAMNKMLKKRDYPLLSVEKYKSIFTFPVQEYYRLAGVNFGQHDWDTVAMEFINNYRAGVGTANLHAGVPELLDSLTKSGYHHFILSAMQQQFLEETLHANGIASKFQKVVGLHNHYAATKEENAKILVASSGFTTDEICMVGDTIHDFEVAESARVRCVLVANGHQSKERLMTTGCMVVDGLDGFVKLLPKRN
nr:HAD family hydrolase [Bacteroidota bacterium]